ncbi:MAG: restriction endonuclease subunit S, partial [Bacteroidaceae bacterium]|nr:restriction endonuclease subunit S [Bacteroidaceae bacterium]
SIFYDMFGDPEQSSYNIIPLSKLSNNKLSYGSGASAIPYNGEIRYIRITDIKEDGKLNTEAVSPSIMEDKYILNEGDILFARSGATVGKTYLYKESDGKAIYAGYLIRFIPNKEQVLPTYIYYYTKTDYYKTFISKSAQAVAQPNINAQQYGSLMVPIPPLPLQHQFASKIEAIERKKELIKQSISETETLFNARMQHYFG